MACARANGLESISIRKEMGKLGLPLVERLQEAAGGDE